MVHVILLSRYPYAEAEALLQKQTQDAQAKLAEQTSDIMFLRDQITTCEVNLARCFNYDVVVRKKQKAEEAANAEIQKQD